MRGGGRMSDLISRQAAFIALNKRAENVSLKTRIGLLDAVRVIDDLPSVEPEKCGDCISRQAALNALEALEQDAPSEEHLSAIFDCEDTIKRLSPVEPERKPGKWVHMVGWWECNQCHAEYTDMPTCMGEALYGYCPMCGAEMIEPQESEDKA